MANTVTKEQIDILVQESKVSAKKMGEKTTVVQLTLPNGFTITESSSCVDPANYDQEIGKKLCLDKIRNKLWELEGYRLQWLLVEASEAAKHLPEIAVGDDMDFGEALLLLKEGKKVCRSGWNGKGMWLRLYRPYFDKEFPITENEDSEGTPVDWIGMKTADNAFVPWLASQTDMLADDWQQVENDISK